MGESPFAREQVRARWNCGERTAIGSVKNHAHLCEPVNVWGADFRVSVAAQMVTPQSVGNDDDDVERALVPLHANHLSFAFVPVVIV